MSKKNGVAERRWYKGSWAALSFALLLFVYSSALIWRGLQVPGDGWLWSGDFLTAVPEISFDSQVIGPPSPIEEDDKLLSIEGVSVAEMGAKRFFLRRPPAPDWPDGTVLTYVVQRDGQAMSLAVPVRRYSFGELFVAGIDYQGLAGLVQIAGSLFFFTVGVIVFLLRPGERAAHALLILGTAFLFNAAPAPEWVTSIFYGFRPPSVPFDTWTGAINPSLMMMALAFPTATWLMRRFPRLTTVVLFLWAPLAINMAYLLNLDNPPGYYQAANAVYLLQILLLFIVVFGSLLHAAFKLGEGVARQQLKWVGLGIASFVVPGVGGWLIGYLIGVSSGILYFVSVAGWFIMPICLAVAITRYRLFDIDLIIRKTLQYSLLTALLALTYFGLVVLLQNLFFQNQQSAVAIVLSTLTMAALFNPLRRRLQTVIDQRFFRKKYDAQQVLARLAQTTRDEVEMGVITAELTRLIQETMQPNGVSVWLKTGNNSDPAVGFNRAP